jgi:hypothetical protein
MPYSIEHFHPKVKEEIEDWPVGILADYARLVELLIEFGPSLRMPHSRHGRRTFRTEATGARGDRTCVLLFRHWTESDHPSRFRKENPGNPTA